jgi:hypothetical protein
MHVIKWLSNPAEQIALEIYSRLPGQEIPAFYGTPRFICAQIRPPMAPIMSQMDPVNNLPPYFLEINFNIFFPTLPSSSKSLFLQTLQAMFSTRLSSLPACSS